MSMDICSGPGVNVYELVRSMNCDYEVVLERKCGFVLEDADDYDLEEEYSSFLDELFYEYAYTHLPRKYNLPNVFSYYQYPATGEYVVYMMAEKAYEENIPLVRGKEVLESEFGPDCEVGWVAFARW